MLPLSESKRMKCGNNFLEKGTLAPPFKTQVTNFEFLLILLVHESVRLQYKSYANSYLRFQGYGIKKFTKII